MGPGGFRNLQNCPRPDPVGLGGFDSHTLPPLRPIADTAHPVRALNPRRPAARTRRRTTLLPALALVGTVAFAVPAGAGAQRPDSVAAAAAANDAARARPAQVDTVPRPPISPRSAFLSSVLLPGYGQSRLDRGQAGALFVIVEAISLAMIQKSAADLREARRFENDSIVVGYTTSSSSPVLVNPTDPNGGTYTPECYGNFAPTVRPTGLRVPVNGVQQPLFSVVCPTRFSTRLVQARRTHVEDWFALLIFNHLLAGADAFVAAHLWDLPARVSVSPGPGGGTVLSATVRW